MHLSTLVASRVHRDGVPLALFRVVRESDERIYPTRCPACRKVAAGPTRVETVKNHQRLLRIDLTCRACGHHWQDIVGVANLDDEPGQTSPD